MMRRGLYLSPASRRLKKRLAAVAFRHSCTRMSSTTPCWSTAEVVQLATDADEHLIQVPGVARPRSPSTELAGEVAAELEAPLSDALVGHGHAPLGEDQLHIPQAEAEHVIEPHRVADDLSREAMPGVGGGIGRHPASLAEPSHSGQRPAIWQCPPKAA